MAHKLSAIDAVHISTVLEDCVDQLAILGSIMPNKMESKNEANKEVVELIEHQKYLESRYEELMSSPKVKELEDDIGTLTKAIHSNTQAINKSFRRNKFTQDAGQKVQADRKFLHDVLANTLKEINSTQSFQTLVDSVNKEKAKKNELQMIVSREETSRKKVKQLQKAIIENRKEQDTELQKRNELIAHLKDQLQETKAKTNMENKYIKKDADVRVACSQKKCQLTEQEIKEDIKSLNKEIENESRCNIEIETFLRTHHTLLEEKVEHWMEKYDTDVEAKQAELDNLKSTKANDLSKLQELTQTFHEYSKVVQDDKAEKERIRKEAERELEEQKACTKLQAWWRGIMVRRQLGPYKPKKKGKKGKKSAKGKKGGKKK